MNAASIPTSLEAAPPSTGWRPWRSTLLGWLIAGSALLGGIPLFIRMPPWCDVTLYDIAARNVLRGGIHYRDVFDTNLPGFVWAVAAVRSLLGWSIETLRIVDLLVVTATSFVLGVWIRRAGAQAASVAWFAAGVALFYPFTSEFNHMQRDVWMLLPAIVASFLRMRQVGRYVARPIMKLTLLEGFLWGLALWLKPHVVVPAALVWLASAFLMARSLGWRVFFSDLAAVFTGVVTAVIPGLVWLIGSGAWPYFFDIFTNWNPEYVSQAWAELPERALRTFSYFPPWSLIHLLALPTAMLALWTSLLRFLRRGSSGTASNCNWLLIPTTQFDVVAARTLLAVLYLGWMLQALLLQKGLDYVHVPETLLALAFLASQRWAIGLPFAIWFIVVGVGLQFRSNTDPFHRSFNRLAPAVAIQKHPMTDPEILSLWPRCWDDGGPKLRDRLGQYVNVHCGTRWEELDEVARYLRTVDPPLKDRELTCFHDSTHPLYLLLDLEPSTRYLHFGTALAFRKHVEEVRYDVASSRQRYVVSDLRRMTADPIRPIAPGAGGMPDQLPEWFPRSQVGVFPWNQPIVFRSGRYVVHHVTRPVGPVDIPPFDLVDQLGSGK